METITVVIGCTAWNDQKLIAQALETAGIGVAALVSDVTSLADQARTLDVVCVLFTPTLPGMTPGLIQELLLNEERPIAAVGLIPAGSGYAAEYQRCGMKGYVVTPLDTYQAERLPALVRDAVAQAAAERAARTFTPVTAEDALAILDRGGWQQQTIAIYSPKGGVGKSTLATNLAVALGVIGERATLLIDADMSRANSHVFLNVAIEQRPDSNLFALYSRVLTESTRNGSLVVRAQTLQEAVRPWRGKLSFLPGIPQMHMAGLEEFAADPQRTAAIFADLLREARGYYEFRVVDTGPDFNLSLHWATLAHADTVLLIVTPEKTALTDVRNTIPALERAFGTLQRFRIVINGYSDEFGIQPKEIAAYLGGKIPVVATLPWWPEGARLALNAGKPLVLEKPLSALGTGILKLGATFYPALETLLRKRPLQKKPGWFGQARSTLIKG